MKRHLSLPQYYSEYTRKCNSLISEYICIAHLRINDDYGLIIIQDEYDEDKFSCLVSIEMNSHLNLVVHLTHFNLVLKVR